MEMNEFLEPTQEELDVQKAVVESLAADKAEQDEQIEKLKSEISQLKGQLAEAADQLTSLKQELAKNIELLAVNAEGVASNKIALIDRELELADRFEGETRDQVLEVLKEARDQAEKDGRVRRAQILEAVLVANEPVGTLLEKREALNKVFIDNGNIVNGPVIEELNKLGISYKNGENYLLPSEILNRNY